MHIDINSQDHLIRVSVRGPCTIANAAELRNAFLPLTGQTTAVMVELDEVTELDTAGLQVLLALQKECPSVLFCYANGIVQRTVEMLNLQHQFHKDN